MLSHGDGIAIIGACAVVIAAIVKLWPKKSEINGLGKIFVHKDACEATIQGFNKQFKLLQQTLTNLESKLDDLNKYLRDLSLKN